MTATATATKVKEHPILFSSEMVRAILEGRKTQTRRVAQCMTGTDFATHHKADEWIISSTILNIAVGLPKKTISPRTGNLVRCPYGATGDRLVCYTCLNGQTNNTQADSGITQRRLQGGIGRANLHSNALCGIRSENNSGLVSAEGQLGKEERQAYLSKNNPLPREQEGHESDSPASMHGFSWDATEGQAGSQALGREQGKQQAVESVLGEPDRELARQEGSRNGHDRRKALGVEVYERRTPPFDLGHREGPVQSETSGACAQCQRVVDQRYRSGGTRLYVRETHYRYGYWRKNGLTRKGQQRWRFVAVHADRIPPQFDSIYYAATSQPSGVILTKKSTKRGWYKRPAIFMPRWASRITLEITNVRVERLQAISERDAQAEGALVRDILYPDEPFSAYSFVEQFKLGWDSINAKRGYSWDQNPWVWCISFRKL